MKRSNRSKKQGQTGRNMAAVILGACVSGAVPGGAEEPDPVAYDNQITFSVGGVGLSGDKANFQRQHQIPKGVYGGVEDLHYERILGEDVFLTVDGKALFEAMDFGVRLELVKPDAGYVRAGYRQYRVWYDGSGGFFPINQQWFSIFNEDLHLDRGEFFFETGLTLPDIPTVRLRYTHMFRDGRKDSTIWGDSNLTGGRGGRGIVPSFRDLDETRDIIQADARHTIGNTGLGLGLRYEFSDQDNSLNIRRRPGENQDRYLTQRETQETDLFNLHAFTDTRFNPKTWLTTGYSFTKLDTDIGGSRIYGADYDPVYDPLFARRQQRDEGFLNLTGGSKLDQHVMNINLMFMPIDHLFITPSIRAEKRDISGFSEFVETNVGGPPALPAIEEELRAMNDRGWMDVSQRLEVRYSGIRNIVLYGRGDWLQGEGDLTEREIDLHTGGLELDRRTDDTRFTQKYTLGANWYPHRVVSFSGQYYRKMRDVDYEHPVDPAPNAPPSNNRYPGYIVTQNFTTDDVNFRVTLRPMNGLTFVTRYDFQVSTIDTRKEFLTAIESGNLTSHIFSESITWMPTHRLYLQAGVNYVLDRLDTPATNYLVEGVPLVPKVRNDYWNSTFAAGYALSDKTDVNANYFYYFADNYENNSFVSQPYGADNREHALTVAVNHKFKENLRGTVKYGYFNFRDRTSGGHNDFDAHLLYSGLQYRF